LVVVAALDEAARAVADADDGDSDLAVAAPAGPGPRVRGSAVVAAAVLAVPGGRHWGSAPAGKFMPIAACRCLPDRWSGPPDEGVGRAWSALPRLLADMEDALDGGDGREDRDEPERHVE